MPYPRFFPRERRRYIEATGCARHRTARRLGYQHYDSQPTIMMDIAGFGAEVAGADYYRVPWNEKTDGRDDGWDIMVGGLRVDVKTCMRLTADWLLVYDKQWPRLAEKCDALLMTRMRWPEVIEICGWVSVDRFIREHLFEPVVPHFAEKYGPKHLMRLWQRLEPPWTLGSPRVQLNLFDRSNPCPTTP